MPRQIEVGQSDQGEDLRGVLLNPVVTHLRVAELVLNGAGPVFDPSAR